MNIDSIHLFGFRVLVERVKEKTGSIIVPETVTMIHQIGRVVVVGDGMQPNGTQEEALVRVGDLVYFQANAMIAASQDYEANGETFLSLHQGDLIGRLSTNHVSYDNFSPLGRWVLVEPFLRTEAKLIVLPQNISNPKFVYFKVAKIGERVKLPISRGQEVLVNTGRLGPIFIQRLDVETAEVKHAEFAYIDRDFILGAVEEDDVATRTE